MYYYLYDSYLNHKRYHATLAKIETRLTDLGINGKINYVSFLKNIRQIVSDEIKRGVKTIVIVGNDKTIGQIINLVADLNVTIGIIPIDGSNRIAQLLGIPHKESACDILSSRIVQKIDLGAVNNNYFFTNLELGGKNITLEFDGNYIIDLSSGENIITLANLDIHESNFKSDPTDGQMDVFVYVYNKILLSKKLSSRSHLLAKKVKITSTKTLPILLSDERRIIKTPAEVKIYPGKIKVIVGKYRKF